MSYQKSEIITEGMIKSSTKSVNLGLLERSKYPILLINNVIDQRIEDPNGRLLRKSKKLETNKQTSWTNCSKPPRTEYSS